MSEGFDRDIAVAEIARALAATNDHELIRGFLHSILTPSEIASLATRWELVKLMDQGLSQRKIAERLGLSLCKITRGSRELKKEDSPFERMLKIHSSLSSSDG